MWSTREGNGKPLLHSCLENPMNSMKRQKDMALKYGFPGSVGAQYTTGEEQSREIAPEGMRRLNQSENNAQVWM